MSKPLSRRNFLQSTATGLSLTWGGARVFAEPSIPPNAAAEPQTQANNFVYGTHFYHPQSGPRPDQFRAMIDAIANKYRFNIIRIYPPWDYYNPRPGEFRFDDLEELMRMCDEYEMRVLMTIYLESAPYWLEQAHPETRLVNANGESMRLGGDGGSYSGGWPGLCLDWEVVQEEASRFVHELVKLSASHRSLYAYDVWNEPMIVRSLGSADQLATVSEKLFCYCDRTIAEFQSWLQRRYGSLDRLNEAWIRRYPTWKAIDPPRVLIQMYTDWLDWRKFIEERTTEYMKFRVKNVRDADPRHIVESHVNHCPPIQPATLDGTQGWRLAEVLEVFGCSFYPRWAGMPIDQGAAMIEITRSCAPGKDFWITELQGGHGNEGTWRSAPMRGREIRMWNWLAVAAGAKGIIYWTYLTEGTGREASGFGLVARGGEPTERVEEAAKANRFIQARWNLLKDFRPQPEVAILFDQDNALLTFVGDANEEPSIHSAVGYYKAFWNLDLWVDFIEPARISGSRYKVLAVPWHLIGKKATCAAIHAFAEQGGIVILESGFARFDDNYYFNPVIPGHGLDAVFGYRENESIMIENGKLPLEALDQAPSGADPYEAEIIFSPPGSARVKANTYLTPIEISSATAIATCRQWTVGAMKKVGEGSVYYLGTNFGASVAAGELSGIDVLHAIITSVVQPQVFCSGKLRPRLIQASQRALLTVFNETDQTQTATINLPAGYGHATDIYNGKQYGIARNTLELSVPFRDVSVFDLE
jgi:beta-galactosidase GanA